jgi:very-short-patch-repair endonuclease
LALPQRAQARVEGIGNNARFFPSPRWGEGRVRGKCMEPQKISTLRGRARGLRRGQTEAERRLWARLRHRQLHYVKFRRQHPVGPFITDFCCPEHRLVVELDGGQHAVQVDVDQARTAYLNQHGYRVLRFWNHEVIENIEAVLQQISTVLRDPPPAPELVREREQRTLRLAVGREKSSLASAGRETKTPLAPLGRGPG